jgi:hypothetical protein
MSPLVRRLAQGPASRCWVRPTGPAPIVCPPMSRRGLCRAFSPPGHCIVRADDSKQSKSGRRAHNPHDKSLCRGRGGCRGEATRLLWTSLCELRVDGSARSLMRLSMDACAGRVQRPGRHFYMVLHAGIMQASAVMTSEMSVEAAVRSRLSVFPGRGTGAIARRRCLRSQHPGGHHVA